MYRSSTQSCPTKAYVPQSETLNSLSAYHSGQGGGATCFISFPEYSVPANAAEASARAPNRHNSNFFIYFSFLVKFLLNSKLSERLGQYEIRSLSVSFFLNSYSSYVVGEARKKVAHSRSQSHGGALINVSQSMQNDVCRKIARRNGDLSRREAEGVVGTKTCAAAH